MHYAGQAVELISAYSAQEAEEIIKELVTSDNIQDITVIIEENEPRYYVIFWGYRLQDLPMKSIIPYGKGL